MSNNIKNKIVVAIQKYNTIILQRHQLPDPDAIGSQMGLAEIIKRSFPSKYVYCVGSKDPTLAWMGSEDTISDNTYKNALVIVTDCANRPRISDQRYSTGKMLIKIDHHPNTDPYGDLMWVNPRASSASEMIYDLCAQSPALKLDSKAARWIYAGIVGDTGRFMYPETTSHTLAVAAQLAKYHFSMSDVNLHEQEISLNTARLYADVYQNIHVFDNGAAYYVVSNKKLHDLHVTRDQAFAITSIPDGIKGIKSWLIFTELDNGGYRVSLRSKKIAINKLAMKYGGGGHALASGTSIANKADLKNMIKDLNKIVNNNK